MEIVLGHEVETTGKNWEVEGRNENDCLVFRMVRQ